MKMTGTATLTERRDNIKVNQRLPSASSGAQRFRTNRVGGVFIGINGRRSALLLVIGASVGVTTSLLLSGMLPSLVSTPCEVGTVDVARRHTPDEVLVSHKTSEPTHQIATNTSSEVLQAPPELPSPVQLLGNGTSEFFQHLDTKISSEVVQARPQRPSATSLLRNEAPEPPQNVATNAPSESVQAPLEQPSLVRLNRPETPESRHEVAANRSTDLFHSALENHSSALWAWENAGGEFGLSADWRKAILLPGSENDIRGGRCLNSKHQEEVRQILARRDSTPSTEKVAACVRTKDRGRYLPEWIAYHYVLGVDEIFVYDDDSVDDTVDILKPFIDAGIVHYKYHKVEERRNQVEPLNDFLQNHMERRKQNETAPKWLTFHDSDEYIYPTNYKLTLSEFLRQKDNTCCIQVGRVQYGTSGYRKTPPGLTLENFLQHASPHNATANRLPKFFVNLDPAHPELGWVFPALLSPHKAVGCDCDLLPVTEIRINHYLGSTGDYVDNKRRYWKQNFSFEEVLSKVDERDVNDEASNGITRWACATREILARVVEGLDLHTGLPI